MAKPDFYVRWQRAGLTGGYGKALWMETRLPRSRSSRAWPWLSLSRQLEFSESVWLQGQGREQTSGTRPTDSSLQNSDSCECLDHAVSLLIDLSGDFHCCRLHFFIVVELS